MKKISEDQKVAIEEFKNFVKSESQVLIISGSAGTGKTSLIKDFAKISKQENWNCIPLGVWGRSSSAIQQITKIPALTVKKYIDVNDELEAGDKYEEKTFIEWYKNHYKKRFDFDLVDKFFRNSDETIGDVLIVDEASTINDEELIKFTNYCMDNADDFKLVFIGDHCQLPPIGQTSSNAFDPMWFEDELGFEVYGNILELTQSHRVSEGPLFELAKKLRPLSESNSDGQEARKIITNSINNKEILGYGKDPCFEELKNKSEDDPTNVIYLAPNNKESFDTSLELRKKYKPEVFKSLDEGELIRLSANGLKEDFVTGDEFKIVEIIDDFDKFVVVNAKVLTRVEEFTGYNFLKEVADFFNIFDNKEDRFAKIAIYKNALSDWSLWGRRAAAPRMRTEAAEAWESIQWENGEDRIVDDIVIARYAYGSTVHSSQGGEWDSVALLLEPDTKSDTARFWYTAVTRAKKELFIVRSE